MVSSFQEIRNANMDDFERPAVLPEGEYVGEIAVEPVQGIVNGKAGEDQYDTLDFTFAIVEYLGGASNDALDTYGAVEGARVRRRFMFDNFDAKKARNSAYYLRRFFNALGLENRSVNDALTECVGARCIITVTHRPNERDPEFPYTEVGKVASL